MAIRLLQDTSGLHRMAIHPVTILGRNCIFGIPSPARNRPHRHFFGFVPAVVVDTAPTRISLLAGLAPRSCAPRLRIGGSCNPAQRPFRRRPSLMRAPATAKRRRRRLCPLYGGPRPTMMRMRAPPLFFAVVPCLSVIVAMRFPSCTGLAGNAHPGVATVVSAGFARCDGGFLHCCRGDAATGAAARPDACPGETAHRRRVRVVAGGKKRYRGLSGYILRFAERKRGEKGGGWGRVITGAAGNAMAGVIEHGSLKKQQESGPANGALRRLWSS
jgi:hypothetical protein